LKLPRAGTGAIMIAVGLANTGYLGIPLIALLLGNDSIGVAVAYDTTVTAPIALIGGFAIGAAFGTRAGEGARARTKTFFIRNPALIALVAAILAPGWLSPDWARDIATVVAVVIAPLGFFAVGVNLMLEHDESGVRLFPPPFTAPVATAVVLRLIVAPAVMIGLSALLIKVPDTFLLEAAMPAGINALVVAHLYGLDMRVTVGAITWSTGLVVGAAAIAGVAGGL
jgi:hypothetical protein